MRAPDAVQEHIWQKVHLRPEASVPRQPFHPVSPTSLPDEAVHEPPSFGGRFGNSLVWACFITVVLGYCRGFRYMSRKHEILVRETFVPARILDVQRRKCVKSAASRQHHARIMPKLGGYMWHITIYRRDMSHAVPVGAASTSGTTPIKRHACAEDNTRHSIVS